MSLHHRLLRPGIALGILIAMPGAAQGQEANVAQRPYVADRVERFSGRAGFQSTIAFAEGERIENIAVGDSSGWQITPNRRADLLFVKPVNARAPLTNMTVVTDRRTYLFQLRLDPRATPVYLLRFTYPAEETAPAASAPGVVAAAETVNAAATLPLDQMNFAWSMKGERRLYPDRVFDDGRSVYLAWAPERPLPAILTPAPDGKSEGPVNFTARDAYLVVEGTHPKLILRSGRDSAVLETKPAPAERPALEADVPAIAVKR